MEGRNVAFEFRWAHGEYDRLPALAADLVGRNVAVLVGVGGDNSAVVAKRATSTIPIIFGMGGDPIKAGLVESLNRPGGNATGFTLLTNQLEPKRVGLMHELVPSASLLGNPGFLPAADQLRDVEEATRAVNLRLFVAKANDDHELSAAFESLAQQRVGALLVTANPYFDTRREQIIALAAKNRLPAFYHFREFATAGGLISYGPRITDGYQQAGIYAGQILKGARPADLPVLQPTRFEFVINLKHSRPCGAQLDATACRRGDRISAGFAAIAHSRLWHF